MSAEINIVFSDGGSTSQPPSTQPAQPSGGSPPATSQPVDAPVKREPGQEVSPAATARTGGTVTQSSDLQAVNQLGQKIADTAGLGGLYKGVSDLVSAVQRAFASSGPRDERGMLPTTNVLGPAPSVPQAGEPEAPTNAREPIGPELPKWTLPAKATPPIEQDTNLGAKVVQGTQAAQQVEQAAVTGAVTAAGGETAATGAASASAGLASVGAVAGVAAAGIGVAVVAVGTMTAAARTVASEFNGLVAATSKYSAAVATATANTEVRQELAAIRRANLTGGNVAELENLRASANDELARIMDNVYNEMTKFALENKELIQAAIDALRLIADNSASLAKGGIKAAESTASTVLQMAGPLGISADLLAKIYPHLARFLKDANSEPKKDPELPFEDMWMDALANPLGKGVAIPNANFGGAP